MSLIDAQIRGTYSSYVSLKLVVAGAMYQLAEVLLNISTDKENTYIADGDCGGRQGHLHHEGCRMAEVLTKCV